MTASNTNIAGRAMLVSLRISTWTARRYDRAVTNQINTYHNASRDAGRYNKSLLPGDCATYKAVLQASTAARDDHYKHTLPWTDEGYRMLPTAEYVRYTDIMRAHAATFDRLVADFVADYPTLQASARVMLNGMYRDTDYPDVATLQSKFAWKADYTPLPMTGDFRVDLPAETLESLETATQDRVASAVTEAMRDAWRRLFDVVAHAHDRLNTPDAIFRDTLIDNVRETCDILRTLNVAGDPDLDAMIDAATKDLAVYSPQILRDRPVLRADVAAKADAIMSQMSVFMGGND